MPILVMCTNPACGEIFDVPEEDAGENVRCPVCGSIQSVSGGPGPLPAAERPSPQAGPEQIIPSPAAEPDETELNLEPSEPGELLQEDRIDLIPDEPAPSALDSAPPASPDLIASTEETGQAAAEVEAESAEIFDDNMPSFSADEWIESPAPPEPAGYGMLERKSAKRTILIVSLLGVIVGLSVGIFYLPLHPVLAAYIGAGVGWVGGFTFGFFLVLIVSKDDGKKLCRFCGNEISADMKKCASCGSSLSAAKVGLLSADYFKAGSCAISNMAGIYLLTMLLVVGNLLFVGIYHFLRAFGSLSGQFRPVLIALCAIAGFYILGYCLEFFLGVVSRTLLRKDEPPDIPKLWTLRNIITGVRGFGVLAMYSIPIFTIPLLPLGLLSMAGMGGRGGLNLAWAARTARRYAEDFMTMWLFLLLWFSGLALALAVVITVLFKIIALIPPVDGTSLVVLSMLLSAVATAVIGAIGCTFGVAIFRCIGMFGRRHAVNLFR